MYSLRIFALLIVAITTHGYIVVPNDAEEEYEITAPEEEQPTDATNAQQVYTGPSLYYYESTLNWYSSAGLCDRYDSRLCGYKELCPDTDKSQHGKQLVHDVLQGDHWVAIQGGDWLQIGNAHGPPCIPLTGMQWSATMTKWTHSTESKPWKGYVFCCKKSSPEPEPDTVLRYIGSTVTYDMSTFYCEYQGRRLCTSSEICVDNKPVHGGSYGDHWVATSDQDNDWVQIGTSNAPMCRHHEPPPEWGKRTNGKGYGHVGYVYCCK